MGELNATPVIPEYPLWDTISILILLLSLPPSVSSIALFLFILTSSSKSFTSKIFNNLSKSAISNDITSAQTPVPTTQTPPPTSTASCSSSSLLESNHHQNHKSFILISLLDLFLCILIKLSIPNLNKLIFVFANAILSTSLTGKRNSFRNTVLSGFSIISIDYSFKFLVSRFLEKYPYFTLFNNDNELFPYLSRLNSNNLLIFEKYVGDYSGMVSYCSSFINLILSIHVILMGFSTVFKNNFISKNINQLSSQDFATNTTTFSSFLLKKEKGEKRVKIVDVDVSDIDTPEFQLVDKSNESIPAAYPNDSSSFCIDNQISTNNIVNENFQVFCQSSFNKQKNSAKSIQPLWAFFATIKAMNSRKYIYSGEEPSPNDESNNSLILSDYSKQFYDELKFSNYVHHDNFNDEGYYYNFRNINIFIEYIGLTLICFNLKNFNSKLHNGKIIVRVNGVIWYQISKGIFNDHQEILIVSGLTPLSQYDIQFILHDNEQDKKFLIDDLIVSTIGSNGLDISTSNTTNNTKLILSPLSTLQESLVTTTDNLNKERLKLKKNRKELSKKISSYKQDIENLKKIVNNSDKNDEKNYKKLLSLRSLLKQVEEEISKVNDEIGEVEVKELEITEFYTIEKRKFDLNQRNFQNFQNGFQNGLNGERTKLAELSNELELLIQKREIKMNKYQKLSTEVNKFNDGLQTLVETEFNNKVKLRNERAEKRRHILNEFKKEIQKLESDVLELTAENETLKRDKYYR